MSNDLILGWALGLVGSLITGVALFWLEGIRDERRERLRQRQEDIRTALNWKSGSNISLRGFNLSGANLSGKNLSGADLESANLEGAILWATNFKGANLRAASFRKTKMKSPNFQEAILQMADFTEASIDEANFERAYFRKTKFEKAKLINCLWRDAIIDNKTLLPENIIAQIQENRSSNSMIKSEEKTKEPPGKELELLSALLENGSETVKGQK